MAGVRREALTDIPKLTGVLQRAVLTMPSRVSKQRFQSVEGRIAFLELVDNPQALQIVFEPTVLAHALVQRILPGVPERGMAEIVGQRHSFSEILVQPQRPADTTRDLRHFDAVRQARSEEIAFVIDEDLRFVFQPPERGQMYDAISVTLEVPAHRRPRLLVATTARTVFTGGIPGAWCHFGIRAVIAAAICLSLAASLMNARPLIPGGRGEGARRRPSCRGA